MANASATSSRQEAFQAVDRAFEVASQQRPTIQIDDGALVPSQRPPQTRRAEHDKVAGRRLGMVEPWCLLLARPQRMRLDECIRRVIASPRRDVGEGIDVAILNEDSLRRRRLGDDDLPAASATAVAPTQMRRSQRPVASGRFSAMTAALAAAKAATSASADVPLSRQSLADRAQGDPGEFHASR